MTIPFYDLAAEHKRYRADLDDAYARVMAGGQFILGRELEAFEREFARYCGAADAIGVGNGLDALRLSLRAFDVGPGDEVIVAAHTFAATWMAIVDVGATPVPCEPDRERFFISAEGVAPLITPQTRAVIPVHLYGIPAPVDGLAALCRTHGLHLLEDAAQAHGALHNGRPCGTVGAAGCFSFYPSKNLGALGDGGAIVTSDSYLAKRLRRLRNYGSAVKYHVEEAGWNSRLDELQAAFLRVKLMRLNETNALRVALAGEYQKNLAGVPGVELPRATPGDEPVWHLFPIRVDERDSLQMHLAAAGIQTAIHYPIPVYRMAPFRSYGPAAASESDRLAAEVLSVPFWPTMPSSVVARVCDDIRAFMARR
jgi:dTDP-4-amino-4,6-dideoxygalactose transaminase